jgi:hypothetical protein
VLPDAADILRAMRLRPVRLAVLALACAAAALAIAGAAVSATDTPICAAGDLSATFAQIPGSQGAGQVGYMLTLTNHGTAVCEVSGLPKLRLLGGHRAGLPTKASTHPRGTYTLTIAPNQWAQSRASFTPDVAGRGEPGDACEPVAHYLHLVLGGGGGALTAPMDATRVCQHGSMSFTRLTSVTGVPLCTPTQLTATFKALGPAYSGQVLYSLNITNTGSPCAVLATPDLALENSSGQPEPSSVDVPVADPYVIGHGSTATVDVQGFVTAAAHEHASGACEPLAHKLVVTLPDGGGVFTVAVTPPRSFCHRGKLVATGLFLNG